MLFLMTKKLDAQQIIPESISDEIKTALTYYPDLKNTGIEFKFKKKIKKSTMQARPTFGSFFRKKSKRKYVVLISETFNISGKTYYTKNMPKEVITGWIGHELGHIMDYRNRNNLNLIWFGIKYLLLENHIVEAERAADTYAIFAEMEDYILKTKSFILNHADIDKKYKSRIIKYYLSPEEIMKLVEKRNKESSAAIEH